MVASEYRAELSLEGEPQSPRRARVFTRELLRSWGLEPIVDVACLLVSELVSNVVLHTSRGCLLTLEYQAGCLRLEARDADPHAPRRREQRGSLSATGRGLALVEALSSGWGWSPDGRGGKVVWLELEAPVRRARPRIG
jgi:anti-sigma regulatory factor (Ser/Thr protein kinase)